MVYIGLIIYEVGRSATRVELTKHMSRYHEKRKKNNIAVKKFRKDKSVKDLGKMKQLQSVRIMMIKKMIIRKIYI